MIIFPAVDLFGGQAVRLYKGDYQQMTVYEKDPQNAVRKFEEAGATHLHLVDLEGAKTGEMTNLPAIERVAKGTDLFIQLGGGIRSMEAIERYLNVGVSRVIIGTAAVLCPDFVKEAVLQYGGQIAVGADIKDGQVAIHGWTETAGITCDEFCLNMQNLGVSTIICTDISKDGVLKGTNRELYRHLKETLDVQIVASGGVSTLEDIRALRNTGIYGAIIGKAYYEGAVDLGEAVRLGGEGG